ncbi:hypothetical protein CEUSTIGMA_g1419.t1 [Chlamydomonas eustigma]|uniref:Nucleoporin Nup54 alpha-helical domain-containing protein n=1 Tax=Chlamydomonas eustigma TaxID=1157962 RepID=A0A250WTB4_9CHLO|nr:hypothetical protein CEUSTIGMA_g1419.t1 [Chlamydomonas eustigma]|eukprot:GAX73969.1 hypothetical protein CEUSTIGMA_g1419.t1 [Chlamydomonas eustigma]
MAFSFGAAPAASTSFFGANNSAPSTPAFGSTQTTGAFSFGGASTPASSGFSFQSASAPSLFGTSTPTAPASMSAPSLFGGTTSSPSLFGSVTPSSTPSLFGASSTPSLFGASSSPSVFGTSQTPSLFGSTAAAPLGMQVLQPQGLITYSTRYDDLPPDSQKDLQEIQREIGSYREDCEKLDRDQRLHDSVYMKKSLEDETNSLKQSLQGMLNSIQTDDEGLINFREKVLTLMRNTEHAVRTYQRTKLWRDAPQQYKGQMMPPQVQELLSSPVLLPSPYLTLAIQGFQQTLENYQQVISELEQALPSNGGSLLAALGAPGTSEASILQALPVVISHMHDYFVHVAAKLEKLHQEVQHYKDVYVSQRRSEGDYSDPFAETRRMASMSATPRPDHRTPSSMSSVQHTYGSPAQGISLPSGMAPFQPAMTAQGQAMQVSTPLPFGTPFGGPVTTLSGDFNRTTSARRRR